MGIKIIAETEVTPTQDGIWRDVDVSALVEVGATGVLLRMYNTKGVYTNVRNNGSTDSRTAYGAFIAENQCLCCIGLDANRIFEAKVSANTGHIYLLGYFDANNVFFINASLINTSASGAYIDADVSAITGADTAIGVFLENLVPQYWSYEVRCNGSTDARYYKGFLANACGLIIGVDANEIFEYKVENQTHDFYLSGYIKSGANINVNSVNQSLSSTNSDIDILVTAGKACAWWDVCSSSASNYYRIRKNGTAEGVMGHIDTRHSPLACGLDVDGNAEGQIDSTAVDFFLIGTFDVGAQTYYETLNDAISIVDAFTRQSNVVKSDTVHLADSLAKYLNLVKSDHLHLVDSRSKYMTLVKDDYLYLQDAFGKYSSLVMSDYMYVTDSFTKRLNVLFKDTIYIVEVFNTGGNVYFKVLSDYLYINDYIYKNVSQTKSDAIHIIDALSKQVDVVFRQDVFFVEVFVSGSGQTFFDVRWDYLYVSDRSQKTAHIQKNEYMGISDSRMTLAYLLKTDIVHISDSLSLIANRVYNDIVSFTDHIRNEIAFTFSTLFNISDRFTKRVRTSKNDNLSIHDDISKQVQKRFDDVVAFSDTRQKHITFTFNDIVHFIDRLVQQFGVTFNDKIQISDSYTKEANINLNDLVTFTDAWGAKHIDIIVNDKVVFEDIKTELTNMGMSDKIKFTDDHFEIKLKTTDMVSIHLAVRLP